MKEIMCANHRTAGPGERLRALRRASKITLQALARELGVHFTTISAWERGRSEPDYQQLGRLAARFGVGVGDLLGEARTSKPRLPLNAWPSGRWKEYMSRTEALQLALAVLEARSGAAGCGPEAVSGTLQDQRPGLADLLRIAACFEVEPVEAGSPLAVGGVTAEERIRACLRSLPPEVRPAIESLLLEWLDLFRPPAGVGSGEELSQTGIRRRRRGLPRPSP